MVYTYNFNSCPLFRLVCPSYVVSFHQADGGLIVKCNKLNWYQLHENLQMGSLFWNGSCGCQCDENHH